MSKFREELNKLQITELYHKFKYFCWRNGVDTTKTKYSEMSEEEFRDNANITDLQFQNLKYWEEKPEYKRLLFLLTEDRLDTDVLEVYQATKRKALETGNGAVIKAFLDLQSVIKNWNKVEVAEDVDEDDGLKMEV